MRMPRSLQLGASLLVTLIAVTTLVVYGSSRLAFDSEAHLQATLHDLQRRTDKLWPEMIALSREQAPPAATRVPHGDPLPTLEAMLAHPDVSRAFHVSPDFRLTVLERRSTTRGRLQESYQVDLKAWRPRTLNLGFEMQRRQHRGDPAWWRRHGFRQLIESDREALTRTLILDEIPLWGTREPFTPIHRWGFEPYKLYVKGDEKAGYLGYAVDTWATTERGKVLLQREGLDQVLAWEVDSWRWSRSVHFLAPPLELPEDLASLRLRYTEQPYGPLVAKQVWQAWGVIVGLIVMAVLGTSATVRQLRGLLDERELALAQSNFVSAVSHEMRTPLTTIKLYAEMLDQQILTEPSKRSSYLQTIGQECDRLTRLVENVLDYSKISRKRREYRFEPVSVQEIAREARACMRAPYEAAGLGLEVEVPALTIEGDRDALVQSLVNLLSNALKYGKDGKRVRLFAQEDAHAVTLGVQDWGPGIPVSEQKRVFEAFYRVGSELTRTAPGTGLGLALVEAHARAYGGKVELESKPGQGSTFRMVLPRARSVA